MSGYEYCVPWKCPHCGHVQDTVTELPYKMSGRVLAYCDSESGGCDRQLVLDCTLTVNATPLKIVEEV